MALIYKTQNRLCEEILNWESYVPYGADKLILGTFPTIKNRRSFEFFYPNKNNKFWEVLANIANVKLVAANDLRAIENRKKILSNLNLGITDIGYKIYRQANSSLDQNIFPLEFTDIFKILDDTPAIKKIIITSTSGQNSVEGWLRSYCQLNDCTFPRLKGKNPKKGTLLNRNKKPIIDVLSVHSTSGSAGKTKEELVQMYKTAILG